jgi:hypothetical protein
MLIAAGATARQHNSTRVKTITQPTPVTVYPHKANNLELSQGTIGAAAATVVARTVFSFHTANLFGTDVGEVEMGFHSAHPLGATHAAPTGNNAAPLLAVRED